MGCRFSEKQGAGRDHGSTRPIPRCNSYRVDGVDYQIRSTALNPDVSEIGDSCTIWYNPAKPKDAQPFHYESNKVYRIILVVGIVLTLLGIILTMVGLSQ